MNNKKIWSIVLVAILALTAAGLIFKFTQKPADDTQPEHLEEVIIEEENIPTAETEEKNAPDEKTEPRNVKNSAKKTGAKVQQSAKKVTKESEKAVSKTSTTGIKTPVSAEIKKDVPAEVDTPVDKTVVVPLKYSSRNTYKYVYTPARFKKTK